MFDLARTIAAPLFANKEYPWQILPGIRDFILAAGPGLPKDQYEQTAPDVWIAKDANVAPTACVQGPCIVCLLYTSTDRQGAGKLHDDRQ